MANVRSLIWDEWNRKHLGRHHISPEEIEEVCHGKHQTVQSYRKRILIKGATKSGRFLSIVLSPEDEELKPYDKTMFKNRQTEASFWEKNIDQAWKNGKQTKVYFAKNLSETINVRFDSNTMTSLRTKAHKKGLGTTQLIRMWIMERLTA